MDYLSILKSIKLKGIVPQEDGKQFVDWGMDKIYETTSAVYSFAYKDKPTSNINDIIHLMIIQKC